MGKKFFDLSMMKRKKSSKSSPDSPSTASSASSSPSPPPSAATLAHQIQDSDDLRRVFETYDTDGDGRISTAEIESMIRSVGDSSDPARDAEAMVWAADLDGDGYISLEEFVSVNRTGTDAARCVEDLRSAFGVYDLDGDGFISAEELHHVMHRVMMGGERATSTLADCKGMIRAVDRNGDGAVDFDEFVKMMTQSLG